MIMWLSVMKYARDGYRKGKRYSGGNKERRLLQFSFHEGYGRCPCSSESNDTESIYGNASGYFGKEKCFWLNNNYIQKIVDNRPVFRPDRGISHIDFSDGE